MISRTRFLHVTVALLIASLFSPVALAQETQPGAVCDPSEQHRFRHVGGPENPGTGYTLVCDGATWKLVTEWDTGSGQSLFQVGDDTANSCTPEKEGRMSYTGGDPAWQYCDGGDWVPLTTTLPTCPQGNYLRMGATGWDCTGIPPGDLDTIPNAFSFADVINYVPPVAAPVIVSDIVQINGIAHEDGALASISGDAAPEFRICTDSSCSNAVRAWSDDPYTIINDWYVQIRFTNIDPGAYAPTENAATLTIGTVSGDWSAFAHPSTGTQMPDGSFYIGVSPADGEPVYMTNAFYQASLRWDNSICYQCGNGSVANSQTDGRANTNALLAFNASGFSAAAHCEGLNAIEAHGHDDWYLPAGGPDGSSSEINLIGETFNDAGAVGGLTEDSYWSSTESDNSRAWRMQLFGGVIYQGHNNKNTTYLVRCVRR